jgi:hypothetical protein
MPYAERTGASKLSVGRDGLRFLAAIVQAAMCYRPSRPLLALAGLAAALGFVVGIRPVWHYALHGELEEWMIYRILLASLVATLAMVLVCAAVLRTVSPRWRKRPRANGGLHWPGGAPLHAARTARARRSARGSGRGLGLARHAEYATTRTVSMHWSRAVLTLAPAAWPRPRSGRRSSCST